MSALCALMVCGLTGCNTIDDDRIPGLAVNINLSPGSKWQTYGVTGFGDYRYFIRDLRQPSDFPWLEITYTGFGGILLIRGNDPYINEANVPLAYDLACPVECKQDVRVQIDNIDPYPLPMAQCPVCKSVYNVIEEGGRPKEGIALQKHYGLRKYQCVEAPDGMGGYLITNR